MPLPDLRLSEQSVSVSAQEAPAESGPESLTVGHPTQVEPETQDAQTRTSHGQGNQLCKKNIVFYTRLIPFCRSV